MRHYVEGQTFLWHCCECGNEQREDEEPYYEDCWGGCCIRRYHYCNNIDCKQGPMARWLRDELRRRRCPVCKGTGLLEIDGDEAPCPADDCLAAELLIRDYISERIFSPSYHRQELGITHTAHGRTDPPMDGKGKVVNKYHGTPDGSVYIGRGSLYGNPFSHREDSKAAVIVEDRESAIEGYRMWITGEIGTAEFPELGDWPRPTREQVIALRGRTLVCYCAPKPCHGEVLLELADEWSASP